MGRKKCEVAVLFGKTQSTIASWIQQFETGGGVYRKERAKVYKKHGPTCRLWIVALYHTNPVLFLDQAKRLYGMKYPGSTISTSSISLVLKEAGLVYKTLERHAIQICANDVYCFALKLAKFPWLLSCLLFLDEVSFDNRGMIAKKGWGMKGRHLYFRGQFQRLPRVSCLTFLGLNGIVDNFVTEGTFNWTKFLESCRTIALGGNVKQFPRGVVKPAQIVIFAPKRSKMPD